MQFKYPEILWGLLLLIIPILIHLFQLRKFKKTPFTNVKLLEKVVAESRKSSTLKKWLLLATRLLLLAVLVLAFAQPFLANKTALVDKETVVYLDNSFSMQGKAANESLLNNAVQELIKSLPEAKSFSLFTNDAEFKNVLLKDVQNSLLTLEHSKNQLTLKEINLKAKTLFSASSKRQKNLILVSDFQQTMELSTLDSTLTTHLVQYRPDELSNLQIDTVYVSNTSPENKQLTAKISGISENESIPVSLYSGTQLIAKTAGNFNQDKIAEVVFSIPENEPIEGIVEIMDSGLSYDNTLYFSIDEKEKIKVLEITATSAPFLNRIFTEDEFIFTQHSVKSLNFSILDEQNFIVINGLDTLPNAMQTALSTFVGNGGSLLIIPSANVALDTYNSFTINYGNTQFLQNRNQENRITNINFSHPLYKNVFERKISNFEYPKVEQYYKTRSHNIELALPIVIAKDQIVKLSKEDYEFIPQQRSFAKKVTLTFNDHPKKSGIYQIKNKDITLKANFSIAFYWN